MITYKSVVLLCSDIEKSKQFYLDLFKLPIELDIGGLVTFATGISLWGKEIAVHHLYPGTTTITNPDKPAQELYFETDSILDFALTLKEKKINLLHDIQVTPWNQRTIRFFDPDGNLIGVGESMEVIVRQLDREGLSPDEISEKTWLPVEYITIVLKGDKT